MKIVKYPNPTEWPMLLARPAMDLRQLEESVSLIMDTVKAQGDAALREYSLRFDKANLHELEVSADEIAAAAHQLSQALKEAIGIAADNIARFHAAQQHPEEVIETMPGVRCWRKSVAIDRVGLYIPGGTAPLFSSVLMLAIPARLAGCREVVLCTPPSADGSIHPAILYAAQLTGVHRVFRVGGAQAIAAMTFGTETIPAVYKIFGPGNPYVTVAKQLATKNGLAIDMPAGPSEVLVCADASARPHFVASDLLSQAEHGADSQVVLVCFDEDMAQRTLAEVDRQLADLPRRPMATQSIANSLAIVVKDQAEAADLINAYAPEHLILAMDDAAHFAPLVVNAGSVFLGHYTPESVGDYASGTNHTLPTHGFARAFSGVSLDSFVKKITYQELSLEGLASISPVVQAMAAAEQLEAHRRAVAIRIEDLS